jgi:hypothetical protein
VALAVYALRWRPALRFSTHVALQHESHLDPLTPKPHILFINHTIQVEVCLFRKPSIVLECKLCTSWKMPSSGIIRRVTLVRTDVWEERSASIIRVTVVELETLAVTSNRRTLRRNTRVPPKRRFLQKPRGVTSRKTANLNSHISISYRSKCLDYVCLISPPVSRV